MAVLRAGLIIVGLLAAWSALRASDASIAAAPAATSQGEQSVSIGNPARAPGTL